VNKELIIQSDPSEISVALIEDKHLAELSKVKNNIRFSVGDIYLARVKKTVQGLNAAFVDVGYSKDAFLHYLDMGPQISTQNAYLQQFLSGKKGVPRISSMELMPDIPKNGKISNILKNGQPILVQIAKEPISTKGPRLTAEISIPGRNLVLIPFSNKINISQKIKSADERNRLKSIFDAFRPKNYGVIVRTVAEGKKISELEPEMNELVDRFESAFQKATAMTVPSLFVGELDRTNAILRDILNESFSNIVVDDEVLHREIREYIKSISPGLERIVKLHKGTSSVFESLGIEKQIKSSFGKTVTMPSGAYLIIEHTEALHVIDVNSGHRALNQNDQENNALQVNLLAAGEIARQLRLRDMGGIIVVDFIDMYNAEHKKKLFQHMRDIMALDRAKHHILPLSKFGIMQITRQRVRPETNIVTMEDCPVCQGTGHTAPPIILTDQIESNLDYLFENNQIGSLSIKTHPFVAAFINKGLFSLKWKWRMKFKKWISIKPNPRYTFFEYHFFKGEDEVEV
jgi:ribonuclease G